MAQPPKCSLARGLLPDHGLHWQHPSPQGHGEARSTWIFKRQSPPIQLTTAQGVNPQSRLNDHYSPLPGLLASRLAFLHSALHTATEGSVQNTNPSLALHHPQEEVRTLYGPDPSRPLPPQRFHLLDPHFTDPQLLRRLLALCP